MAGNRPVPASLVAGRVEIVVFGIPEDAGNPCFRADSFYLKACFTKSEIGAGRFCKNLPSWIFRRPYPTLLTKPARSSRPGNPLLPHTRALPGFRESWIFRTSFGVDFQIPCGKPAFDFRDFREYAQIPFSFYLQIDAHRGFPGEPRNPALFCWKQSI